MSPRKRTASSDPDPEVDLEWIGGRVELPLEVLEPKRFHPKMDLWLEIPSCLVVGSRVVDPNKPPDSFATSFFEAARKPLQGKPRRPPRVRVASRKLAAELAPLAAEGVEVCIAPTPEIDAFVEEMMLDPRFAPDDAESYLEEGRVPARTVEEMFIAARYLWTVAPWKRMYDGQVLRCDIPSYGIQGACVSIIGNLGESFGILIFRNQKSFESFALSQQRSMRKGRIDLGSSVLSLEFDPANRISPRMLREVEEHDWEISEPWAYPRVFQRDRDGTSLPLTRRDVEIATVCAMSLATFYVRNEPLLDPELDEIEPISMTVENEIDVAVRFTYPYEAYDLFEPTPTRRMPQPGARETGRNDPCPCGSGKKYKRCHLEADEYIQRDASRVQELEKARAPIHETDERLTRRMIAWARGRFAGAQSRAADDFRQPASSASLLLPWSVYGFEVEGHPIVWHFLRDPGVDLNDADRRWLEAQQRAWLSVWEVEEVEPGRSLVLLDLLSGSRRRVHETSASQLLVTRDTVLARVVDGGEESVLCGMHPRSLPPREAAVVVKRLHTGRSKVSEQSFRSGRMGHRLIGTWEAAVEGLDRERKRPMQFHNTDGEKVVFTTDHWTFDVANRGDIATCLEGLDGVQDPEEEGPDLVYTVVKPGNKLHEAWENTIIAKLTLGSNGLTAESNSTRRANGVRRRIESACGEMLRERRRKQRSQSELLSEVQRGQAADKRESAPTPPEIAAAMRQHKQRYYEQWLDERIPALGGKTPREAARLASGRTQLDLLLKEMENLEARIPEQERVDFNALRARLGL